ncbi:MAG: hypothetical protein Q9M89_09250 [Persephonella sp.]|nr:hypothetical protein [Persephonella sp.]
MCHNRRSTRYGGAITAGLFLEKFVDKKIPWVHIDIAGTTAHNIRGWYYHPKGATGFPVKDKYKHSSKKKAEKE